MSYRSMHPQFKATFEHYDVPVEMQEAFWNYLAYGLSPGSFGVAVLDNDFCSAVCRSHPALTTGHLRHIAKWLMHFAPANSYGSSIRRQAWMEKTDDERREIMIECGLRPSVVDILKGIAVA